MFFPRRKPQFLYTWLCPCQFNVIWLVRSFRLFLVKLEGHCLPRNFSNNKNLQKKRSKKGHLWKRNSRLQIYAEELQKVTFNVTLFLRTSKIKIMITYIRKFSKKNCYFNNSFILKFCITNHHSSMKQRCLCIYMACLR